MPFISLNIYQVFEASDDIRRGLSLIAWATFSNVLIESELNTLSLYYFDHILQN
jgi:hypothetical protein